MPPSPSNCSMRYGPIWPAPAPPEAAPTLRVRSDSGSDWGSFGKSLVSTAAGLPERKISGKSLRDAESEWVKTPFISQLVKVLAKVLEAEETKYKSNGGFTDYINESIG